MPTSILQSPIGRLVIQADESFVTFIGFKETISDGGASALTEEARLQLEHYFEGRRSEFNFPIQQAGSDFQQKVWQQLLNIKAGKPISYLALSKQMNNPLAIRAIASANGKNNLMVVVPCHRVIGSNGDLVGYSAGLWRKKWLLEHETVMMGMGQSSLSF